VNIGRLLLHARLAKGLDQKELARRSKVWPSQLCRYERGGAQPSPRNIEKLARGLGLQVSDMIR